MGVSMDEPTVELLARLGGWDGRKEYKAGKMVLNLLATEAILGQRIAEHGELPSMER